MGAHINAAAREIPIALIVFEAAFGVPGPVLAPILYARMKEELVDRGLL